MREDEISCFRLSHQDRIDNFIRDYKMYIKDKFLEHEEEMQKNIH